VRLLLDTHALLWWLDGDRKLPPKVRKLIAAPENEILVSAASVWEITTKARIGKLRGALAVATDVPHAIAGQGFVSLSISVEHAQRAGSLPGLHRDPFDRMLIAQSEIDNLPIATNERVFDSYGVTRIW
jgi:PIN domain nuclease of toxin-antitoxin system